MPTPLPNPATLLNGIFTLQRRLADLERGFFTQRYSAASSDGKIQAVADGLGRLTSLTIDPSLVASLNAPTLADRVKTVINAALTAANQATQAAMRTAALTLSLPGLPAQGQPPPDFTGFPAAVNSLAAKVIAANPCNTTQLFTCQSGPVTAVVSGRRQVVTLTYPSPLPGFVPHLETSTVNAVNCAIDKATDRADDTPGVIDTITGGSATFQNLVLYASNVLDIELNAIIRDQSGTGFGMVGNSGAGSLSRTDVDAHSEVGNIISRPKVTLSLSSHVHGFIRTASTVFGETPNNVDGPIFENAMVVLPDLSLNVAFPATNSGNVTVQAGQQRTLAPGAYNRIEVELNATLFVSSGVYFCNEFDLDPGGRVVCNTAAGPVFLYIKNKLDYDGTFVDSAGGFPNLFVGYVGSLTLFINKPFTGTLVAPNAKIDLQPVSGPHFGAFHAKDIEVDPNTIIHRPFPIAYENLPGLVATP